MQTLFDLKLCPPQNQPSPAPIASALEAAFLRWSTTESSHSLSAQLKSIQQSVPCSLKSIVTDTEDSLTRHMRQAASSLVGKCDQKETRQVTWVRGTASRPVTPFHPLPHWQQWKHLPVSLELSATWTCYPERDHILWLVQKLGKRTLSLNSVFIFKGCVTLNKCLPLNGPRFPHLYKEGLGSVLHYGPSHLWCSQIISLTQGEIRHRAKTRIQSVSRITCHLFVNAGSTRQC